MLFPVQGMFYNCRQIIVPRAPTEFCADEICLGHDFNCIATPARADPSFKATARYFLGCVEHLLDGVSASITAIGGQIFAAGSQVADGREMSVNQIGHVDVIA